MSEDTENDVQIVISGKNELSEVVAKIKADTKAAAEEMQQSIKPASAAFDEAAVAANRTAQSTEALATSSNQLTAAQVRLQNSNISLQKAQMDAANAANVLAKSQKELKLAEEDLIFRQQQAREAGAALAKTHGVDQTAAMIRAKEESKLLANQTAYYNDVLQQTETAHQKVIVANGNLEKAMNRQQLAQQSAREEAEKSTGVFANFGQSIERYVVRGFERLVAGYLGVQAVFKGYAFLKDATDKALQLSAAEGQLANAAGKNTRALEEYATAQMKVSANNHEDLLQSEARIASFTEYLSSQKQILKAAEDLAAAKQFEGITVTRASDMLVRTIYENSDALKRYGIDVNDLRKGEDRLEGVMRLVNERFGGRAEAIANTDYGKIIQADNELAEKEAQIGKNFIPWRTFFNEMKLSLLERSNIPLPGEAIKETDLTKLKTWSENLRDLLKNADGLDKSNGATWRWKISLDAVQERIDKLTVSWHNAPWTQGIPGGPADFNAAVNPNAGTETVPQKKDEDAARAAAKKRAEEDARMLKDIANKAQDARIAGIQDAHQREWDELVQKQNIEMQKIEGHEAAVTAYRLVAQRERENLLAKQAKDDSDKWLEAENKKLDKSTDQSSDNEKRKEALDLLKQLHPNADDFKKQQSEMERHKERMVAISMQMASSMGHAFGGMFSGQKGALKNGLKEMLMTVVDFGKKELEVYLGIDTAKNIAQGPTGWVKAGFEIAGIEAAGAMIDAAISSFAVGTNYAPGGLAYVHQDELINLPRGSQVFTSNQTKNIMDNSSQNLTVHLHDNSGSVTDTLTMDVRSGRADRLISTIMDRAGVS